MKKKLLLITLLAVAALGFGRVHAADTGRDRYARSADRTAVPSAGFPAPEASPEAATPEGGSGADARRTGQVQRAPMSLWMASSMT